MTITVPKTAHVARELGRNFGVSDAVAIFQLLKWFWSSFSYKLLQCQTWEFPSKTEGLDTNTDLEDMHPL